MKNHINKISSISESNNNLFEGIFGIGKKKDEGGDLNKKGMITSTDYYDVKPDESVNFKNGSVALKIFPNYSSLREFIINKKKHQWIIKDDSKFICRSLLIQENNVVFHTGEWIDGVFLGNKMNDFIFKGGYFNGGIFNPGVNGSWDVSPYNFIDGKWVGEEILGIKNKENFSQKKFNFNILSIPVGNKMVINTENGKNYEIHVLKRLDSTNSDFVYKIKFPKSETLQSITIKWKYIRGGDEREFGKMVKFSNSQIPLIFEDKFGIKIDSPILQVIVMSSTEYLEKIEAPEEKKSEEELSKTQKTYDLYKVNFLGINNLPNFPYYNDKGVLIKNNIGRVYLNPPDDEYSKQLENVIKNLDNKIIESDFRKLKLWLDAKSISGAPKGYDWLANLIGKDETKVVEDKNFLDSLNRIEAFLRYFVDVIVLYAGKINREKGKASKPNNEVRELIKNNLRKFLELKSEEEQISSQAKAKTNQKIKSLSEKKEISNLIKEILIENLKHF